MLVAENPNFVSKIVIGQSYEGRPLNVLKVKNNNKQAKLQLHNRAERTLKLKKAKPPILFWQEFSPSCCSSFFICNEVCYFPFLSCSSALVEPTVLPSGSTLESTPESGSLRPAGYGLLRRWVFFFSFSLIILLTFVAFVCVSATFYNLQVALNIVFSAFLSLDCDWLWNGSRPHCNPQSNGHLSGDCHQPWWIRLHPQQCESFILSTVWFVLE